MRRLRKSASFFSVSAASILMHLLIYAGLLYSFVRALPEIFSCFAPSLRSFFLHGYGICVCSLPPSRKSNLKSNYLPTFNVLKQGEFHFALTDWKPWAWQLPFRHRNKTAAYCNETEKRKVFLVCYWSFLWCLAILVLNCKSLCGIFFIGPREGQPKISASGKLSKPMPEPLGVWGNSPPDQGERETSDCPTFYRAHVCH